MIIYQITNTKTDDFYIGKTTKSAETRWYFHQKDCEYNRSPSSHLYNAIRKYGVEHFVVSVIDECSSLDELNTREIEWIATLHPAYNIAKGGDGGWIHDQTGNRWKVKDSSRMGKAWKDRKRPREIVQMIAGTNNYQSTHFIDTPWGTFSTWKEAVDQAKLLREQGNYLVVTDVATLRTYCEGRTLNVEGRRTQKEWRGKHTKDLGFGRRIKSG